MNQNQQPQNIDQGDTNPRASGPFASKGRRDKKVKSMQQTIREELQKQQYAQSKGKSIRVLADQLNSGSGENYNEIKQLFQALDSKQYGQAKSYRGKTRNKALFNRALYGLDVQKIMDERPNEDQSSIMKLLARDLAFLQRYCDLTKTEALELVALDDFGDFLDMAANAVGKVIPFVNTAYPVAKSLYSGIKTVFGKQNQAEPLEQRFAPKIQESNRGPIIFDKAMLSPTRVDVNSLAYVLAPSKYKGVARYDDVQAAALYTSFMEIPVVPGTATGSAFVVINPANVTATTGVFSASVTYTASTTDYSPSAGTYTIAPSVIALPLQVPNTANQITNARIVGCEVTYKSTIKQSTNNNMGQYDVWHEPGSETATNIYSSPSNALTLNNAGYHTFYQRGPITDEVTQCLYNPLDSIPMTPTATTASSVLSPIVFMFSGCNTAGVQVGIISIHFLWNVIPTPLGLSSLPLNSPGVGPYTADIMDTIFTMCPEVFVADQKTRLDVLKSLLAIEPTYESIMSYLLSVNYSTPRHAGYGANIG